MLRITLCAAVVLSLAAGCASSSDTPTKDAASPATTTSGASTPAASGATGKATAATTPAAAAKSGATAADACSLITADEASRVMGVPGLKPDSQPELAGASYCMYNGPDGSPVLATAFLRAGAAAFNAYAASAQPQSGLGDKAQWDASTATLMILKGQTVLSITAGDGRIAPERRLELSKQLGAIGVARQ